MIIQEKEIDKIVKQATNEINLAGGCYAFVHSLQAGNTSAAIRQLEEAIQLSISRSLYKVLKEIK